MRRAAFGKTFLPYVVETLSKERIQLSSNIKCFFFLYMQREVGTNLILILKKNRQ